MKIRVIKKEDKEKEKAERIRAEQSVMSIYIRHMAREYPDAFKKLLSELKRELC